MTPFRLDRAGVLVLTVSLLGLGSAGCGRSGPPRGDVSGTVTFKDQPVTEGKVTFFNPKEGVGGEGDLRADGRFTIKTQEGGLLVGDYIVFVSPLTHMKDTDPGKTPPSLEDKPAPNIPAKYRRQDTTPLRATVKEGENDFPFDLTP
ncbi:MAG: carboxypeptidase regulatory-like domain-containing protein [Gemmataceae bacterium]|nr:carboxypeptidase regulatory-like domain-containing protein [Gemmataceae bacterium]